MRFGLISKNEIAGSRRIVEKFLWKPLKLNHQTRWLEKVKILQVCTHRLPKHLESLFAVTDEKSFYWDDVEWYDDEKSNKKRIIGIKLIEEL